MSRLKKKYGNFRLRIEIKNDIGKLANKIIQSPTHLSYNITLNRQSKFQKATSNNLEKNIFSVRFRCDVLAHRSTNSRASLSAGRLLTVQYPTGTRQLLARKNVEIGVPTEAQPWGDAPRFATLQHGDCTVYVLFAVLFPRGEIV